jgi:integrase
MLPILDAVNTANKAQAQLMVPKNERTLDEIVKVWRETIAPHHKPRGRETAESHLRAHIFPELGQVPLSKLDALQVQTFVNKITPGRSGKTVENIVLTLTGILHAVHKLDKTVPTISFSDLTLPEKEKAKPRVLSGREIKKLIKASRGAFRTILIVLALTGLRINEVLLNEPARCSPPEVFQHRSERKLRWQRQAVQATMRPADGGVKGWSRYQLGHLKSLSCTF